MRVVIVLSVAISAAACGGSDSGPTTPQTTNKTVDITTNQESFLPPFQEISQGDTVRWTFTKAGDGLGHNVHFTTTASGTPANIGTQGNPLTSGSQSRVFNTKGDFLYVCDLHGGMTGEVVVE